LNSEIGQFSDTLKENRREYENVLMMKEKGGVDNILSGYEQALRQSELIYLKLTQDVQMINGNLDD
jgi:RNA-binding protein YhbY